MNKRLRSRLIGDHSSQFPDPKDFDIQLPQEVWSIILKFLDPKSLNGLRAVSKTWSSEISRLITLRNKKFTPSDLIRWGGSNKRMLQIKEILEQSANPAIFSSCSISSGLNLERAHQILLPKFGHLITVMELTFAGFKFQKEQSMELLNMVWDVLTRLCTNVRDLTLDLPKKIHNKYDLVPIEFVKSFHQTVTEVMKQISPGEITNLKRLKVGGHALRFFPELVVLILVFSNPLEEVSLEPAYYPRSRYYKFKSMIVITISGLIFTKALSYINKNPNDKPTVFFSLKTYSTACIFQLFHCSREEVNARTSRVVFIIDYNKNCLNACC